MSTWFCSQNLNTWFPYIWDALYLVEGKYIKKSTNQFLTAVKFFFLSHSYAFPEVRCFLWRDWQDFCAVLEFVATLFSWWSPNRDFHWFRRNVEFLSDVNILKIALLLTDSKNYENHGNTRHMCYRKLLGICTVFPHSHELWWRQYHSNYLWTGFSHTHTWLQNFPSLIITHF